MIGILAGPEHSNTTSNGKDTQRRITPGNQPTRFTLHKSLKPITDNTRLKIKGDELMQGQSFASSPSSNNVCRRINQSKCRIANVDQTPFSRATFKARMGAGPSGHLPHPYRPGDTENPGTRPLPTQPPRANQRRRSLSSIGAKRLPRRKHAPHGASRHHRRHGRNRQEDKQSTRRRKGTP